MVNPAVAAIKPATLAVTVTAINHELGWILLGFGIFTLYATILITQTNTALFTTFLLLFVTLIVLAIGQFNAGAMLPLAPTTTIKIGGYLGVITAARRLVHLGGRHRGRHRRQDQAPRGPGAGQMTTF